MPISLQKIQSLLYKSGFVIDSYFVIADKCEYIKCNSINTGESILIKISRSFSFRPTSAGNTYNLNLIDFEVGENVMEKYSDYPSKNELKKKYGNMIKLATTVNSEEIEADLENRYKMNLELKSLEREQLVIVKSCFRQLKRIALVLTGLKYRVCIIHHKYLTIVNEDTVIDSFYIRGYQESKHKMFFVMMDLEYFYEKIQSIDHDLEIIQHSIYTILDRNSVENNGVFEHISRELQQYAGANLQISKKKVDIQASIIKYKQQLTALNNQQDVLIKQYSELNTQSTSYFNDANVITKKGAVKKQIDAVDLEKQKLFTILLNLKRTFDDIYLSTDNIEFDNCILMNGIIKNMDDIKNMDTK